MESRTRWSRIGLAVLFSLFLIGLGLVFTRPLWRHAAECIPYARVPMEGGEKGEFIMGDHFQFQYILWLFRHKVVDGQGSLLTDPYQFSFPGEPMHRFTMYIPSAWPCHLASLFTDSFLPFNLNIWVSFLLAGWATYLWIRRYVDTPGPAVLAAVIMAAFPYRLISMLGSSPTGFAMYLIPLGFWCVDGILDRRSRAWAFVAGFVPLLLTFGDMHCSYFFGMTLPAYLAFGYAARYAEWKATPFKTFAKDQALRWLIFSFGLIFMVAMVAFVRARILNPSVVQEGFSLKELQIFSPTPYDLIIRNNPVTTRAIYPGFGIVALAAFGLLYWSWKGTWERRWIVWAAALGLLGGYIIMVSPNSPWLIVYLGLRKIVPMFGKVRQTGKLMVIMVPFLALLAALGLQAVLSLIPRPSWKHAVTALAALVMILDFNPFQQIGVTCPAPTNAAYEHVYQERTPTEPILCLPIWPGDSSYSSLYLYFATRYPMPMMNMHHPAAPARYVTEIFESLKSLNKGEIADNTLSTLDQYGVRFILIHKEVWPDKVSKGRPPEETVEKLTQTPWFRKVMDSYPIILLEYRAAGWEAEAAKAEGEE
ncbi:MAG: hypothetical protein ACOX52_00810 [Verrucomicrobiota bacterium]